MVAGADLASASRRAVRAGALAGDLVLDNPDAPLVLRGFTNEERPVTSVIRTGQGTWNCLPPGITGMTPPTASTPPAMRCWPGGARRGPPGRGELGASYAEYQDSEAVTDVQAGFLTGVARCWYRPVATSMAIPAAI
ncbi:hypothetical protein HML84_11220 [Alcanivorax sp. IO_7]|nr:hypothetical protein HML84_11220 [Alcanivorax sp. IO_7]